MTFPGTTPNQKTSEYPYKSTVLSAAERARTDSIYDSPPIMLGPERWVLSTDFENNAQSYYKFKPRADDLWIVTFPRSGTTLTQEVLWLLSNNLNYDLAKIPIGLRFPMWEWSSLFKNAQIKTKMNECNATSPLESIFTNNLTERFENMPVKRFIKTHIPLQLLPPDLTQVGCKVVYVARNPKDTAVSYYHFHQYINEIRQDYSFEEFWKCFENNLVIYAPYWTHLQQAWEKRHQKNFLFLFYEDIIRDPGGFVQKAANFLEIEVTQDQIASLVEHMGIENFKKNPAVNMSQLKDLGLPVTGDFIRNGITGGWKNYFTEELNKRADRWIEAHLKKTDLRFPSN